MSVVQLTHIFPSGLTLEIAEGDITSEALDAIVNAANRQLQHGGGVAAAIAQRGGPVIQAESDAWVRQHGPVEHARPAWTHAGNLPCQYVIHAVGPVWGQGEEDAQLIAAVHGSLETAISLRCESLALPAISTGIFGFPRARAARVILGGLRSWAIEHPETSLRLVRVVLLDAPALGDFLDAANEVLP